MRVRVRCCRRAMVGVVWCWVPCVDDRWVICTGCEQRVAQRASADTRYVAELSVTVSPNPSTTQKIRQRSDCNKDREREGQRSCRGKVWDRLWFERCQICCSGEGRPGTGPLGAQGSKQAHRGPVSGVTLSLARRGRQSPKLAFWARQSGAANRPFSCLQASLLVSSSLHRSFISFVSNNPPINRGTMARNSRQQYEPGLWVISQQEFSRQPNGKRVHQLV